MPTDAINAVIGVGAPSYTSGDQTWNGAAATLKAKPTTSSATPASRNASLRSTGIVLSNAATIFEMFVVPVAP